MTLVKVNNRPVGQPFDAVFNQFWNTLPGWSNGYRESAYVPAANIHETKDAFHVELNVPGYAKEDFQLKLDNGVLTISLEKKEESKSEEYKTLRREFSYRSFTRSFHVDEQINADAIEAKYEQGILKVLLPKKEEVKVSPKKIEIR